MLILPLPSAPDWRRPPWVTLSIIVICCLIYLGLQLKDGRVEAEAYKLYFGSELHELELPRYLEHLKQTGRDAEVKKLAGLPGRQRDFLTLQYLLADAAFIQRLHQNQIVRPDEPLYPRWQQNRARFEATLAKSFTQRFMLRPAHPTWASMLLHMFMHGSVDHLLGNMAVLFIVGYTVEAALGAGCYLAFYILAGLGATAADLLFYSDSYIGTLGASGAIAGVMAMFVVIYGLRKIRFFYYLLFYMGTLQTWALLILPVWLGNELLQKLLNPGSNVNYFAHFCGLLTGALLTLLYRGRRGWQTADHVIQQEANVALQQRIKKAENLLAQLQFEPAARLLADLAAEHGQDRQLVQDFYQAAKMQSDPDLRQQACRQVLHLAACGTGGPVALAAEAWQYLSEHHAAPPRLGTADWLRLTLAWLESGHLAAAEQILLRLAPKAGQHPGLPTQLYRLGQAFQRQKLDERALHCWRTLLKHFPDSAEARLIRQR